MKSLQEKYNSKLIKTIIKDWNYYYSKYKQNKKGNKNETK